MALSDDITNRFFAKGRKPRLSSGVPSAASAAAEKPRPGRYRVFDEPEPDELKTQPKRRPSARPSFAVKGSVGPKKNSSPTDTKAAKYKKSDVPKKANVPKSQVDQAFKPKQNKTFREPISKVAGETLLSPLETSQKSAVPTTQEPIKPIHPPTPNLLMRGNLSSELFRPDGRLNHNHSLVKAVNGLVGVQRSILQYVLEKCNARGSLNSGAMDMPDISEVCYSDKNSVKVGITRLVKKGLLTKGESQAGRNCGFTSFNITTELRTVLKHHTW